MIENNRISHAVIFVCGDSVLTLPVSQTASVQLVLEMGRDGNPAGNTVAIYNVFFFSERG